MSGPPSTDEPLAVVGRPAGHRAGRRHRRPGRPRLHGLLGRGAAVRGRAGLRPVRQRPPRPPVARAARGAARPPTRGPARSTRPPSRAGVRAIRASIAAGDVYQVNLTRRLSAPLPAGRRRGRARRRAGRGQPGARTAPWCGCPTLGCQVASASPERFLRRDGDLVSSAPIKGTAADPSGPHRQGPGRERDDRRPRAQRPRPGVRVRVGGRCPRCSRSSTTPASSTSCPR